MALMLCLLSYHADACISCYITQSPWCLFWHLFMAMTLDLFYLIMPMMHNLFYQIMANMLSCLSCNGIDAVFVIRSCPRCIGCLLPDTGVDAKCDCQIMATMLSCVIILGECCLALTKEWPCCLVWYHTMPMLISWFSIKCHWCWPM